MTLRALLQLPACVCMVIACAHAVAQDRYATSSHLDLQGTWPAPVPSIAIDDIPRYVVEFVPAGGPLFRYASRAGGWYGLVHLPMTGAMPAQLWLWLPKDTRDVQVTVLDRPPGATPSASIALPLRAVRTGTRLALQSVPFAMPVDGNRAGAFVLIEQWNSTGARALPVWVQLRSVDGDYWGDGSYGYVAPHEGAASLRRERAPTSPLQTPRYYSGGLLELPFGGGSQPPAGERATVPR